jgi:hypothetical protein
VSELLLGTRKGLFALDRHAPDDAPPGGLALQARAFPGETVDYAMRDPRTGRTFASVTSPFYGPKIWYTDEPPAAWEAGTAPAGSNANGQWKQAQGVALPEGGAQALQRIWVIVRGERDGLLYAGGDPGVLFESDDNGERWRLNAALFEHPTRASWQPGGGGLCLHSISTWPGEPDRLALAISAAGVWITEDAGASWRQGNDGLVARYLPDEVPEEIRARLEAGGRAAAEAGAPPLCVHRLRRARLRPERIFMQFHGGVYRSDDAGASWVQIGRELPSDFGFPLAVDPADPDSAYVIPLRADMDRVTPGGRVSVYETRDAGATWSERHGGLPDIGYLTILRHAFDACGEGPTLELYFGTTSGEVFGSSDAGASWNSVASRLAPVLSVSALASR